jgi:alkylhydroperoxidase/carboxymuconolactone decarboxylase family protein YurZ
MAISERAQRNHDALFPDHRSTLKESDPELVEIFDNWAFDEVLRDETLDARTRLMVQLAALIASQAVGEYLKTRELLTFSFLAALGGCEPQLAGHVAANLVVGNDRRALVSTITHLLPFIGYPRTLNALRIVNECAAQ